MSDTVFDDDPTCLPSHLLPIYLNPHRCFGLDPEETNTKSVRYGFRKSMLGFCKQFWGLSRSKMTIDQLLFAYHLLRRNIVGPAQSIKESLSTNTYMDFRPEDLLPILRPIQGNFETPPEYRAFRNLNVVYKGHKTEYYYTDVPKVKYIFHVHYCLRKHTIEKTLENLRTLNDDLTDELLSVPQFPEVGYEVGYGLGFSNRDEIGEELASFIRRVHNILAIGGTFSPRLLMFLNIDYERVQSEEEGAIMAILDSPTLPRSSCWYIVDEMWLKKWRRFAMGRGPRRYLPPGPIKNEDILSEFNEPTMKALLQKAVDYRCVNCNVWMFYKVVHGGGPTISRKDADIYSDYAISYLNGVILVQSHGRMLIAKNAKRNLYMKKLSMGRVAQSILASNMIKEREKNTREVLSREALKRLQTRVFRAAQLTQQLWRKRHQSIPEEKLARAKQDQDIFARSKGFQDYGNSHGKVVRDIHPIVKIGSIAIYKRTISADVAKLPFKLKKLPWMDIAVIAESSSEDFEMGSKILSINGLPTSSFSFVELKERISKSSWPMTFELERPLQDHQKPSLDDLMQMSDLDLQYSAFKIMISSDFFFIKHSTGESARATLGKVGLSFMYMRRKPYLTRMILTGTDLFYKSEFDTKKKESDMWRKLSLFSIKFITNGEDIQNLSKKVNRDNCFAIATATKELVFELPEDNTLEDLIQIETEQRELMIQRVKEDRKLLGADPRQEDEQLKLLQTVKSSVSERFRKRATAHNTAAASGNASLQSNSIRESEYHKDKTRLLINCMKKLVDELRRNQTYLDTEGVPTTRKQAISSLRKVAETQDS